MYPEEHEDEWWRNEGKVCQTLKNKSGKLWCRGQCSSEITTHLCQSCASCGSTNERTSPSKIYACRFGRIESFYTASLLISYPAPVDILDKSKTVSLREAARQHSV